jgi:hypothetical protein
MERKLKQIIILAILWSFMPQSVHALYKRNHYKALKDYRSTINKIEKSRKNFQKQYQYGDEFERKEVIKKARKYILRTITQKLIPAWYGTKYNFNGYTDTPKKGRIACGFFVSTILKHAGFNFNRIKMGQRPSPFIIKSFVKDKKRRKNFYNKRVSQVIEHIENEGRGLYIMGLDRHVGLIYYGGLDVHFAHATQSKKKVVVYKAEEDESLGKSKWRMVGKLFDDKMMKQWLFKKKIKVLMGKKAN